MMMHVKPPKGARVMRAGVAADAVLIRLCKTTVSALKADLAACLEREDARQRALALYPPYPGGVIGGSVRGLCAKQHRCDIAKYMADPTVDRHWKSSERRLLKKLVARDVVIRQIDRDTGFAAANRHAARCHKRALELVQTVADMPAQSVLGAAHKAAIIPYWQDDGFDLNDAEHLVMSIINDVRLLGTGGPIRHDLRRPACPANA